MLSVNPVHVSDKYIPEMHIPVLESRWRHATRRNGLTSDAVLPEAGYWVDADTGICHRDHGAGYYMNLSPFILSFPSHIYPVP